MDSSLEEIVKQCVPILIDRRGIAENSCELIFSWEVKDKLDKIFIDIFGPPRKPIGRKPEACDRRLTGNFGGIQTYQKLFAKKTADSTIVAVFRPWRRETHITVKLGIIKNAELEKAGNLFDRLKQVFERFFVFFSLIFFMSASLGSRAEAEKLKPVTLSLKKAIDLAFTDNKDIKIQVREIEKSAAKVLGAESEFLPQLNLEGGYTYNDAVLQTATASSKKDAGVFSGYENDNLVAATANTILFNSGHNVANYKQADTNLLIERERLRSIRLDVEFEAKRLYYGLLLAYETERINHDLVMQAEAHFDDARKKFNQGTVSRFDVLQSQVHVSTVIPDLVKAKTDVELVKAELVKLLSIDIHQPIETGDKLSYSPPLLEVDEGAFLNEAYVANPDIALRALGIDVARYGITMAESGNLPTVKANAKYFYRSNDVGDMVNEKHNNWNVGVSINIPIFDGFSAKAKVDEAKARYTQSDLEKANTVDQVVVNIRKACLDVVKTKAIIKSQEDSIDEAREALRLANVGYNTGVNTNLDVFDSEVALSQVEKNLASATYDYLMARAELDKTMGREFQGEER